MPTVLMVNGKLEIEAEAQQALEGYVPILVNGVVSAPESLAEQTGRIQINSSMELYP